MRFLDRIRGVRGLVLAAGLVFVTSGTGGYAT